MRCEYYKVGIKYSGLSNKYAESVPEFVDFHNADKIPDREDLEDSVQNPAVATSDAKPESDLAETAREAREMFREKSAYERYLNREIYVPVSVFYGGLSGAISVFVPAVLSKFPGYFLNAGDMKSFAAAGVAGLVISAAFIYKSFRSKKDADRYHEMSLPVKERVKKRLEEDNKFSGRLEPELRKAAVHDTRSINETLEDMESAGWFY